ncbi:MAG: hypothetical protein JO295_13585 [Verrucomicrobia bacterium]|nr:hypothetical protein [Verrucomicrobiota bacterium]
MSESTSASESSQAPANQSSQVIAPPIKSGVYTTEFWLTIVTLAATFFAAAGDKLPPHYAVGAGAVAAGLYAVSRGLTKSAGANLMLLAFFAAVLIALTTSGCGSTTTTTKAADGTTRTTTATVPPTPEQLAQYAATGQTVVGGVLMDYAAAKSLSKSGKMRQVVAVPVPVPTPTPAPAAAP